MNSAGLFSHILMAWLITIAVMDMRIRKVRNWMVLLGLVTGTVALFSGVQPFWVEPLDGLFGMLVAFAALLPFYAIRWMGAGDVKFAAVIGLWFGLTPYLLTIWVGGSLLAGVHGLAVVSWRAFKRSPTGQLMRVRMPILETVLAHTEATSSTDRSSPVHIQRSVPYAGYLAICAIWVAIQTGPSI